MASIFSSPSSGLKQLAQLEIEPFSEARWSKIEQGVFDRLQRGGEAEPRRYVDQPMARRRWAPVAWAVAGAACLTLMVVGWLATAAPTLSRISTGASTSRVALPGIELELGPESTVVVSGSENDSQLLVLDKGEVTCDVAHRRPGKPFFVQAGEVRVEVIGTRFRVVRDGEMAKVSVQEGVVNVSARGSSAQLVAGQSWPPPARSQGPTAAPSEALVPAAPVPSVEPDRRASPLTRPSTRRSAEGSELQVRAASANRSLQAEFEAAARLEARSPTEAIRLYRELEAGSSSWAQNALFARGRLEAARGNRAEARRALRQYLERFPRGPNADDARTLLARME